MMIRTYTCGGCRLPYNSSAIGPESATCPRCNPGKTLNTPIDPKTPVDHGTATVTVKLGEMKQSVKLITEIDGKTGNVSHVGVPVLRPLSFAEGGNMLVDEIREHFGLPRLGDK
jgi:hypothetical protein